MKGAVGAFPLEKKIVFQESVDGRAGFADQFALRGTGELHITVVPVFPTLPAPGVEVGQTIVTDTFTAGKIGKNSDLAVAHLTPGAGSSGFFIGLHRISPLLWI